VAVRVIVVLVDARTGGADFDANGKASRERALQKAGGRSRPFGGGKKTPKWATELT